MGERFRCVLLAGMLPIVVYVAFAIHLQAFFPIKVSFGPKAHASPFCMEHIDYLIVRNNSLFSAPMRDWRIQDSLGYYRFPDRWLASGAEIHLYSGKGTDDRINLYAGRRSSVWAVNKFSYIVWYAGFIEGSSNQMFCDPAW